MKITVGLLGLVVVIAGIMLHNCTSPLSDVPIDDPSLIEVDITVERDVEINGDTTSNIKVYIYDKNKQKVELKDGYIKVNGTDMTIKEGGSILVYYEAPLQAVKGSTYTFDITLADGSSYLASVTTPNHYFYSLDVPDNHPKAQDLTVSWQDPDADASMTLTAYLYCVGQNTNTTRTKMYSVAAGQNSHTISSTDLADPDCINEIKTVISSKRNGTIDSEFRSGSSITATFTMAKKMLAH